MRAIDTKAEEVSNDSPELDKENGELISRADAIRVASGYCHPANIAKELEKLPPTPSRPKGHWIINADGYYPYCSECKTEPKSGDMTDFCPSCGADMRGKQDE